MIPLLPHTYYLNPSAHLLPCVKIVSVSNSAGQELETSRQTALDVGRNWNAGKLDMALRALQLQPGGAKESLDAIAADHGCSRETVRRSRNELAALLNTSTNRLDEGVNRALSAEAQRSTLSSPAVALALRRLLTMTGPMPWDEVLNAWARAGGRAPYLPLPSNALSLRDWLAPEVGLHLSGEPTRPVTSVTSPETLDRVGQFLFDAMRSRTRGINRSDLLLEAERAGLRSTTIATTLSSHPAVIRLGRGTWGLRGVRPHPGVDEALTERPRSIGRTRPTSFSWGKDGTLDIEFTVPSGPSPVLAVPKAITEFVEGREFEIVVSAKPARVSVRNARLWGFGPLVSQLGLFGGSRALLALNLISGTAMCRSVPGKEAG